jgi:NPCBM/NEW2 domain
LKSRAGEDLLLARAKDGEVLAIAGLVESTEGDRLQFRYQDRTRTLPLTQVEGWVMAARPDPRSPDDLRARLSLFGGLAVSGIFKDLDSQTWTLEAPWGQALKIPAAEVQDVRFRGGAMTHLCDLEPRNVDETPFFGHRMPWRRDVGLLGEPLSMSDQKYEHGIAVHSRCHLTYDLGGRYSRFEAVLGFDDAAQGRGRVDCRVVADGKELYAKQDLRGDEPPVALSLAVTGAQQLRLEVDFGSDQDAGDRIIWANPRLFRAPAAVAGAGAPGGADR